MGRKNERFLETWGRKTQFSDTGKKNRTNYTTYQQSTKPKSLHQKSKNSCQFHTLSVILSFIILSLDKFEFGNFILLNRSHPHSFGLVCLYNNERTCSHWICIAETWKFLCVLLPPKWTWDFQQFAIGDYFILRTEVGKDLFISSQVSLITDSILLIDSF